MAPFVVECADAALRLQIARWLGELNLPWPRELRMFVHVGLPTHLVEDQRPPATFRTMLVQAGAPSEAVRTTWTRFPAVAEVSPLEATANIWLSTEAISELDKAKASFLTVVLTFALRRMQWFHIHGVGLVDPCGRGWFFVGNSGNGKSTTAAALMRHGWSLVTDDIGFLAATDHAVTLYGIPGPIGLREKGRLSLGLDIGRDVGRVDATGFSPEGLGGAARASVDPSILVFPRLGDATAIARAVARNTLSHLVRASKWVLLEPRYADDHLAALGRLAGQCRCFDLTIGPDLLVTPQMLESLVE